MFYDLDPLNQQPMPTDYDSMRCTIHRDHPIHDHVHEPIRSRLETAVDLIALAYEQANQGRFHLFGPLTDSGVTTALLAFELVLRDIVSLPEGGKRKVKTMGHVMKVAEEQGVLPLDQVIMWNTLLEDRNQLVHGDYDAPLYGVMASRYVGLIIDMIGTLTAEGVRSTQ